MESNLELKEKLLKIKASEWSVSGIENKYAFVLEMMPNLGSTDPVLRDELILELICKMINEKDITDEEVKDLLELIISDKHLFYSIGKKEEDSVFNRAFSVLILVCIINRHNTGAQPLFTEAEINRIHSVLIKYVNEEIDVRGYVRVKGWAHSAAHTADALGEITHCKELVPLKLIEILVAIKNKVCINYYLFADFEDERLITAVINIIESKLVIEDEIITFIKSFGNIELISAYPEDYIIKSNRRNFLSALYFRLKRREELKTLCGAVETMINTTTAPFFI